MKAALIAARILISLAGTCALLLGILFWTGRALNLLPFHMLSGVVLVAALWAVSGLAIRASAPVGLILLVIVISLIMPLLGMEQATLMVGSWHWLIRLLHLLVGAAAMGSGHVLARRAMATVKTRAVDQATELVP